MGRKMATNSALKTSQVKWHASPQKQIPSFKQRAHSLPTVPVTKTSRDLTVSANLAWTLPSVLRQTGLLSETAQSCYSRKEKDYHFHQWEARTFPWQQFWRSSLEWLLSDTFIGVCTSYSVLLMWASVWPRVKLYGSLIKTPGKSAENRKQDKITSVRHLSTHLHLSTS